MRIKSLLNKLKEKDEIIPIEKAKEILSTIGIKIDALDLPNLLSVGYTRYFRNLELKPYMDFDELKIRVTGEYESFPADFHLYVAKKSSIFTPEKKILDPPITRIKINTFGRIKN
jgi:hypothetical protein